MNGSESCVGDAPLKPNRPSPVQDLERRGFGGLLSRQPCTWWTGWDHRRQQQQKERQWTVGVEAEQMRSVLLVAARVADASIVG